MPRPRPADPLGTAHLRPDIARRSVRGGAVTLAAQVLKLLLQFATIAVLGRLLGPEAFGLVAMVAVLLTLLEQFKDLGLSAATVQREDISHAQVSVLFWTNAGLGLVAALVAVALSPVIARFYGEDALVAITLWLAAGFVLSGLGTQHLALLRRQMRFGRLAAVQLAAELSGMAAAVLAALDGWGYWSLVAQRLAWAAALTGGAWLACGWRPERPRLDVELDGLLGFGGHVTAANLVNFVTRSLDQILIGWWWGAAPLGLYERASKLLLLPINNLNAPLYAVLLPSLSRLAGEPDAYRRLYLRTLEKLVMVTVPAAVLMVTMPEALVRLVFGDGWLAAAPIVAWLGVAALYQPATYTCSWLFMSQGRAREMMHWGLLGSTLTTLSIVAAVPFGPVWVAASYAATGLVVRMPLLFWMVGRRGPVAAADFYRAMLPSAAAGVLAVAATWRLEASLADHGPAAQLAAAALVAFTVAFATFLFLPQSRRALRELARVPGDLCRRRLAA